MAAPLRILGSSLVAVSLVIGATAASTAYLVPVDRIDPGAGDATLHAPAGRDGSTPPQPVLRPGSREAPLLLQGEHLALLRDSGVTRVHLKEFSLARWRESWLFGLAVLGLMAGAAMLRLDRRRQVTSAAHRSGEARASRPEALLDAALEQARRLRSDLEGVPATAGALARLSACVERMQSECFDPFVECRRRLVGELGMAGYAQLMDCFAAAERQFNRAWSAAADGVPAEATECFGHGLELLQEARGRLRR